MVPTKLLLADVLTKLLSEEMTHLSIPLEANKLRIRLSLSIASNNELHTRLPRTGVSLAALKFFK